jgi:hypothetical protein
MGLGSETYGGRAKQLVGRAQDLSLTGEMFEVQRRNLEATHQQSEQALQKACALIEKAPAVHAAGFRACFPIAFSFVYVYRIFRASVHLVDGQGGSLEMQQRAFAKGDALVVASFMPYSREALQVAEAAKTAGCRIVAITDSVASPLSLLADETLLFTINSPSFFPSVAAGVAGDRGAGRTAREPRGQAGDPAHRPGGSAAVRVGRLPRAADGARKLEGSHHELGAANQSHAAVPHRGTPLKTLRQSGVAVFLLRQEVMTMKQVKHWQDPVNAVLGVWLIVSPWVLGFSRT